MKLSRFFGLTTREAMRQVRMALGPDALIISNRRVNGGVEIVATDTTSVPLDESVQTAGGVPGQPQPVAVPPHGYQGQGAPMQQAVHQGHRTPMQQPVQPAQPGIARPAAAGPVPQPGMGARVPPGPAGMPPQPTVRQHSQQLSAGTPPTRPGVPSPMSPLGAYAAAYEAAYGGAAPAVQPSGPAQAPDFAALLQARAAGAPLAPNPAPEAPAAVPGEAQGFAGSPVPAETGAPGRNTFPAAAPAGQQPDIMDAIGAMKGALESRIDELLWSNQLKRAPQAAVLFQNLLSFGFSTALLRAMLKRLPEQVVGRAAFQWARQELVEHLPVVEAEDSLWQPGLALALVGPTGVGKTTTIAKLAARCVRRFGPDKLVLITTDTYRIGAHEQLKIYAQMLRVPVHVVRNVNELRNVVAGIRPDQIILIDNVGISQRDRYIHEQAAMLAGAGRDVMRLLVLNAASHGETLDEVARSYTADGGTPLKGCIITKVDEATRLGAALDTALRYRLPIHYVSTGQKVPEHLAWLPAAELVDRALTQSSSTPTLYAPTEADLAALLSVTQQTNPAATEGAGEARRQQLQALPRLLSMTGGMASRLSADDLRAACEFIDELACASEAYDLWRALSAHGQEQVPLDASVRHMMRVIQNEWTESGQKHLLAVHESADFKAQGESSAQMRATFVLDAHGAPLTSPMQQLVLPAGWISSCGLSQARPPSSREALAHQIDWLNAGGADLPFVHLFPGGSPAQWRELAQGAAKWLAHVPAITRVYMEDGSTTAQALARGLAHQPVADPLYLFSLTEVAGGPAAGRALWVAEAPVNIAARGQEPMTLQMVSARLVDRETGKILRHLIGLHPALDIPAAKLAAWLVIKAESREILRHAAAAWAEFANAANGGVQYRALVSAQAGMAAWQLRMSPLTERGRNVSATMLGRSNGLAPAAAATGLFKLFALKEMLSA